MADINLNMEAEEREQQQNAELSEVVKFAIQLLERAGAYTVLCPACGSGEDSVFMARRGFRVTAFDISSWTTRRINRMAERWGASVDSFTDDIISPRRPWRRYDAIFSHNILHQLSALYRRVLLRNFHRALKLGGILIVSVLSDEDERYGYGRQLEPDTFDLGTGEGLHFYSLPELHEELSQFFEVTQIEEMEETHWTYGGKQRYRLLVAAAVKTSD